MVNTSKRHFLRTVATLTIAGLPCLSGCNARNEKFSLQAPWINDAEFIGYFIAIHNGYYTKLELPFNYQSGGPDKIADQVLLSGKADVALTNPETTVALIVNENAPFVIIGAQYQKSPLGIVSLEQNNIRKPSDLVGKRLAVPAANRLTVAALLKLNNISIDSVRLVPYAYDPSILLNGGCDATVDFVTNVPFAIKKLGGNPTSFLMYDYGLKVYMDTVVVHKDLIQKRRKAVVDFLRASRLGWEENFKDLRKYPPIFADSFFKGTGRSVENELEFNSNQAPLIESTNGVFSMSEQDIQNTVESLNRIGLQARRNMFDTSLLDESREA